jgi:hypothetical protein
MPDYQVPCPVCAQQQSAGSVACRAASTSENFACPVTCKEAIGNVKVKLLMSDVWFAGFG